MAKSGYPTLVFHILLQLLAINLLGCVPIRVEHSLMVECSSSTEPGSLPSLPVATIKSQAMSTSNLRELQQML